jgi:mannosyl-oligosaccharide glucosidase
VAVSFIITRIIASVLDQGIPSFKKLFESKFDTVFPPTPDFNLSYHVFSRDITANLLGGIGYFYGNSIVDQAFIEEWDREDDAGSESSAYQSSPQFTHSKELFTATPSRSFFPRGFYWYRNSLAVHNSAIS